jgi:hypothetical protein
VGRVSRVAAASHGMHDRRMSADRMPVRRCIAPLADIPFCHVPSRPARACGWVQTPLACFNGLPWKS